LSQTIGELGIDTGEFLDWFGHSLASIIVLSAIARARVLEVDDAAGIKQQFIRFLSVESLILPVHQEIREVLNQPEAVLALLRRADDDPAYQDSTRQTILAEWAAHYGDFDLAFAAFRRALIDLTSTWYADFWRPHYAVALRDPRFKSLSARPRTYRLLPQLRQMAGRPPPRRRGRLRVPLERRKSESGAF
jgi:hypothetical protein